MGEGKKRWTFLEPALCHLRISFWKVIKEDVSGLSPEGPCVLCRCTRPYFYEQGKAGGGG